MIDSASRSGRRQPPTPTPTPAPTPAAHAPLEQPQKPTTRARTAAQAELDTRVTRSHKPALPVRYAEHGARRSVAPQQQQQPGRLAVAGRKHTRSDAAAATAAAADEDANAPANANGAANTKLKLSLKEKHPPGKSASSDKVLQRAKGVAPRRGRAGERNIHNGVASESDKSVKAAKSRDASTAAASRRATSTAGGEGSVSGNQSQGQDKRTLRSHDGASRLKSDLAIYFGNFDDIINDVPQEPEYIRLDAKIYIVDEPVKSDRAAPTNLALRGKTAHHANGSPAKPASSPRHSKTLGGANGVAVLPDNAKPHGLNGAQPLDLTAISKTYSASRSSSVPPNADPLPDSVYLKAHGRAERREKHLRNIEKERAQHEKAQLELLLDGLQGPDWLKLMGITGITDSERKEWEPKRDYFVGEVRALVRKFREYREEEKRLKTRRDEQKAAEEEVAEAEDGDADGGDDGASSGPGSSDLDARAAHQLQQEASQSQSHQCRMSRSTPKPPPAPPPLPPPHPRHPHPTHLHTPPHPTPPPPSTRTRPITPVHPPPFTSFFSAPHLRAQALGKQRHGRSALAFGLPLPDVPLDAEFALPPDLTTAESLRAHARKRRKVRRESRTEALEGKGKGKGKG